MNLFIFMFVPCMPVYVQEVTELRHICVEGSVSLGRGSKQHGVSAPKIDKAELAKRQRGRKNQ